MKLNISQLIDELQSVTRQLILTTNQLRQKDPELLTTQPAEGKWSVAQVLEHLNTYGRYYLPAIEKAFSQNKPATITEYKPGWAGDLFTKMMRPKEGRVTNRMQAPKGHRPKSDLDSKPVIDEFLNQQQQMLELLELARKHNLGSIRIPITITRLIKLKVGDVFRFLIAHEERHFVQIKNTLELVENSSAFHSAVA